MKLKHPAFTVIISVVLAITALYLVLFWRNRSIETPPTQDILSLDEVDSKSQLSTPITKSQEQIGGTQQDVPKSRGKDKEVSKQSMPKSREQKKGVSHEDVDGIEKVLTFMGYFHSGHTIMVAMVDAHPNIVISRAYDILKIWGSNKMSDKYKMCSEIFQRVLKVETPTKQSYKGYSFAVPSQWHGNFLKLKVIGSGTVSGYDDDIFGKERSVKALKKTFPEMEQMLGPPMMIHVVRNPFDMIATHVSLRHDRSYFAQHRWDQQKQANFTLPVDKMLYHVNIVRKRASGVLAIQREPEWNNRLLEIHNVDFVNNPKGILQQICDFLDIDCPKDYLESCDSVAFKTLSKSRHLINWQPEVVDAVNKLIKDHPFFSRYSFDCDC